MILESQKHYSYPEIFELINTIFQQIKTVHDKDYFTDIIGVARAGFIPAQILSYKLNVNRLHSYGARSYAVDNTPSLNGEFHTYQIPTISNNEKVLIVDEICDTGTTFNKIIDFLQKYWSIRDISTCSLLFKTNSSITPTFFGKEVPKEEWAILPWEEQ